MEKKRRGIRPALIKNKAKRAQVWAEQKNQKRLAKKAKREKRKREIAELGEGESPRPKQVYFAIRSFFVSPVILLVLFHDSRLLASL